MHLKSRILFESGLLRVTEVGCQAPRSGFGPEEPVESPRLIFPRRGVFECRRLGRTVTADSNSALLMNGGDLCRMGHPAEGGDDCSVLVFRPELFAEVLRPTGSRRRTDTEMRPFGVPWAGLDAQLQYHHRRFHYAFWRQPDLDPLAVEEAGAAFLRHLAQQLDSLRPDRLDTPTQLVHRKLAERARSLLASQPTASWSLGDLARLLDCSPFHLARIFRTEVGMTLHQYRLRLRFALALERLAQGEKDLSRLALELGFASHSHFSAGFRRFYGQPPSWLRQRLTRREQVELRRFSTDCV